MKKQIFIAVAFIAAISIAGRVYAQEAAAKDQKMKATYDLATLKKCVVKIIGTENGGEIVFNLEIKSPRDVATGQSSGKRQHKPIRFAVSSEDNTVTEIKSPRDAASGQASGKRTAGTPIGGIIVKGGKIPGGTQFNKIVVEDGEFTLPADCPDGEYDLILSWSWGASNSGGSKSYTAGHFILTMEGGACMAINTKGTGATNR